MVACEQYRMWLFGGVLFFIKKKLKNPTFHLVGDLAQFMKHRKEMD